MFLLVCIRQFSFGKQPNHIFERWAQLEMSKELKRKFQFQQKELRKIINSWNLIPGFPTDEFDALNHKILSHLGQQLGIEKLEKVIHSELITYYGLSVDSEESKELASEVWDWWTDK